MSINAVSAVGPRAPAPEKEKKKDPMEQLLLGLQIAKNAFGMAVDVTSIQKNWAEKKGIDATNAGHITGEKEHAGVSQGQVPVAKDTPGSTNFKIADDSEQGFHEQAYILGEKKTSLQAAALKTIDGFKDEATGKTGSLLIDSISGERKGFYPQEPKASNSSSDARLAFDKERFGYQKTRDAAAVTEKTKAAAPGSGTYEQRVSALKPEARQRFDSSSMGLNAVRGMGDALANGDWTFSLKGDNDFTRNRANFEEAIGRMQSGGAINDDEASRFRKMAPTATDSAEQQQTKMRELYAEMSLRVKNLGFEPDEVLSARDKAIAEAPKFTPKGDGTATAATNKPPAAIKPGTVENGYTFIGGNPADQANWEKVKK